MTPRVCRALALAFALASAPLLVERAHAAGFLSADQRQQDFEAFCRFVADDYAYFDIKATDWQKTCTDLVATARDADDRESFVGVLERALGQLYDPHAHLGTHTPRSPRLVPSGAEVMASWRDGKAVVTALRQGSAAASSGLRVGDEIEAINGVAVLKAAAEFEPVFVRYSDKEAHDCALEVALAGRHERSEITLALGPGSGGRTVSYPAFESGPSQPPLTLVVTEGIAHVRIHNSLGEQALVAAFDSALSTASGAKALVIDLRDTPSGGTSQIARGIMGRLIDRERPYQRHEMVEEFRSSGIRRIWVELVAPRGPAFEAPVVVLVGRWTGSMGEGLAIGLDAIRGAPVLGEPMAHLLGALGELALPNSGIVVRIPVEKIFQVDGRPRESFVPCPVRSSHSASPDRDPELQAAFDLAAKLARTTSNFSSQSSRRACD
jgi:carboxyl-terminal processing protease